MKILLVSHSYPPHNSPRALRWGELSRHLASMGHEVFVVCEGGAPGAEEDGVWVDPVPGLDSRFRNDRYGIASSAQPKAQSKEQSKEQSKAEGPTQKSYFKSMIKFIYNVSWKQVMWPDYACLWILPAYLRSKKLIKKHQIEHVITVSHPFSGHIVGLGLKQAFPKLHWLADNGDPFALFENETMNNTKLYRGLSRSVERRVLSKCQAFSVTTMQTKELYSQQWPQFEAKISVQGPLLRKQFLANDIRQPSNEVPKFLFVGTLYKNIRNPRALLSFFARYKQQFNAPFELHFVGETSTCQDEFDPFMQSLSSELELHGLVSAKQAGQFIEQADVLLNIGNVTSYQLPSKVVEYCSTGKPIVNFTSNREDSAAQLLKKYPLHLNLYLEESTTSDFEVVDKWIQQAPRASQEIVDDWKQRFAAPQLAAEYLELLQDSY